MKKTTLLIILFLTSFLGFAQTTYYSENFQSGGLNGWTVNDTDGDGNNWSVLNASGVNASAVPGSLMSFSWTQSLGSLTPDNLVTSPAIDLTGATAEPNMYLFFDHLLGDTAEPDKYSVYVTTSNDPAVINAATPVLTVTPTNTTYTNKSVNISSFLGQTIYISFRHYESPDQYFILIDNIVVRSVANNDAQFVSAKLNRYSLQGVNNTLVFTVKNVGLNAITNLTINWNDGTDHSLTVNRNIAVGATANVSHPTTVSYATVVEKNLQLNVSAVNGSADPTPANNTGSVKFNTVSQSSAKKVFFEEGTGTWCGWCPRGAIAMAYMETTYPTEFVGVAVHNQDPMMITDYDNGADFSGFPGMNVDRVVKGADVSQSTMISNLNARKTLTTPVSLDASGSISGSQLTVNAQATFRTNFANSNYRLGVIISEDNVIGTATGYRQTNYYANNANGAMGGYETLPNPVPAAQMIYNHVGRALLGGYAGQPNSVPASITDGQTTGYAFNYTIPATSNLENLHAVLILIDQDNGEVVNSKSVEISALLGVKNPQLATFDIYPNPANDFINISNVISGNYTITIYDMSGKLIQSDKKEILDNQTLLLPIKGVSTGEYIVNIASGTTSYSKHLLVK